MCIKEELGQLSLQSSSPKEEPPPEEPCDDNSHDDSTKQSPSSPGVSVDYQNPSAAQHAGWIDGLLGCLRPVWTIIGKAAANEIKGRQGDQKISSAGNSNKHNEATFPWCDVNVMYNIYDQSAAVCSKHDA